MDFVFGWSSPEMIPDILKPFSDVISPIQPYLIYIQTGLILMFGYLAANSASSLAYTYMRNITDYPTAATVKTMTRIVGIALILAVLASVFNVNPAVALTVGSFGGLVVGFATQTVLSNFVSGLFLLISRPFAYGDVVTVSGQTGVVKEIRLMHLVLDATDGTKEILIPSGIVVNQTIHRVRPTAAAILIRTVLALDEPPKSSEKDSIIFFNGRLTDASTEKPLAAMAVKVYDSDLGRDDLMALGRTDDDGRFSIQWRVKKVDPLDDKIEVFAKFDGDSAYHNSKSRLHVIHIK